VLPQARHDGNRKWICGIGMVPVMLLLSVAVSKFFGSCRFEEFRFKSGMVKVEVQHERYNYILITSLCAA